MFLIGIFTISEFVRKKNILHGLYFGVSYYWNLQVKILKLSIIFMLKVEEKIKQ